MKYFLFGISILLLSVSGFPESLCDTVLQEVVPMASLVGIPLSFKKALSYAISNLPPGKERNGFISDVKQYLNFDESIVKNRRGIRYFLQSSKIEKDEIIWKTITPQNYAQALGKVFEAMQLVEEQKANPLGRYTVFRKTRKKYVGDFLDTAKEFVILQGALVTNSSEVTVSHLNGRSKALFENFRNIVLNLLWFTEYRGLKDLRMSGSLYKSALDPGLLQKRIDRASMATNIFWYYRHLRNIGTAATLGLLAVLIPELTGSYFHELNLERLEENTFRTVDYTYAESIVTASTSEVKNMLRNSLDKKPSALKPEEEVFFKEIKSTLENSH